MKFWLGNILILTLLVSSLGILYHAKNPEKTIIGKWEEVSWEFERLNVDTTKINLDFEKLQKKEVYKNLIIHDAEIWDFKPGKKLTLKSSKSENITDLKWAIKGRGHILELKYNDEKKESYQVHQLTDDTMVVFFNFDLQIRGIVKMTFKKINTQQKYAQKI